MNIDKLIERALKKRRWRPLDNIEDLTGWGCVEYSKDQ